jgi:hypothetical protein
MQIREQVTVSADTYNKTADGELRYVGHSFNQGVMYFLNVRLLDGTGGYVMLSAAMRQVAVFPAPIIAKLFSTSQHYLQICVHKFYLNRTITVGNMIKFYAAQ